MKTNRDMGNRLQGLARMAAGLGICLALAFSPASARANVKKDLLELTGG